MRDAAVPSSPSWPFARLSPGHSHWSHTDEPRTEHRTPGMASPVLSRGERTPSSAHCQYLALCSPGYCWPPLPQGHVVGLCSSWSPQGSPGRFLPKLLSCQVAPAHIGAWGCSSPNCMILLIRYIQTGPRRNYMKGVCEWICCDCWLQACQDLFGLSGRVVFSFLGSLDFAVGHGLSCKGHLHIPVQKSACALC